MSPQFAHGYALLIGVGATSYQPWSLPVTIKDVQAIRTILVDPNVCAYPDSSQHVKVLHSAEATREGILEGLAWLESVSETDLDATIIVYFSGHGLIESTTSHYYLIPSDVQPFDIEDSALDANRFIDALRKIKAKRLLVIVDSCHAEGMATSKDEPVLRLPAGFLQSSLPSSTIENLKQGEGRAVFTSSRGKQPSGIRPDQSMSIYTHHLIEALLGAGNRPGDANVRISNLMNHLSQKVPESARVLCNIEQTPFFDTLTEDFPIAMLMGGKGLPIGGWDEVREEASQRISSASASPDFRSGGVYFQGQGSVTITGPVIGRNQTNKR